MQARRGSDVTLPQLRVYLAGPYTQKKPIDLRGRQLHNEFGIKITSRWHKPGYEPDASKDVVLAKEERARYGQFNIEDVHAADWLVLNVDLGTSTKGGMHFEHGLAWESGLFLVLIGNEQDGGVFTALPENNWYPNWQAFIQLLRGGKE